ncbi:MobA/MobL family protein [Microvirga yunnanensis]|uniref:MobA/MobL family protein n=1 Tax=Microvirga yunnanensis TaxID=2953740 RepID=UPI0021CA630D|nr:MobA/MobL family protein [Microvirga sp. HBU65207]
MTEQEAEEMVRRDTARALAISGRIAEAERRAQERVRRHSTSPKNLKAMLDAMKSPGLRSARDFNRSMAFKTAPRPQAPDTGGVTFHFSVTSVSKTNYTVAAYAGRTPSGSAAQHESYIERDGAAETFVDPESLKFAEQRDGLGLGEGQSYIERDAASEKHEENEAIVVSSFGNIGDSKEDRLEFWQKLERAERSPKDHKFTINPFRGAAFWEAIDRYAKSGHEIPKPLAKAIENCKTEVTPYEVHLKDAEAIALLKFAHTMGDFLTDGAIKVSLGRGGRVQTRIIAELPHEITAAQRLKLAKEYCSEFERQGLPYWAVIHAPDKHNDRRNFHIHIALSERPAKQMVDPATGKVTWDFEIIETFRSQSRNLRSRRPFMQDRIREMSSLAWVGIERRRYKNILNKALEAAGSSKRYDHRSYKAMGLTQKAKKRIDPKIYAKERKGQVTEQGIEAARQQWIDAAAELDQQSRQAATTAVNASYKNRAFFTALHSAGHPDSERFQRLIRRSADLYSLVMSAVASQTAANFVADKMVSRARLKKPAQRTKIDRVLIEVAAEVRATEGKQFGALADRFAAEYREKASQIAHIRADFARSFQKQLFGQFLDMVAPSNPAPGPKPRRRGMSLEEIREMTAGWFPKHTSLSDSPSKPTPQPPQESAVDRYLGKNFFNPKNAGKMPEGGPKPVSASKPSQVKEATNKPQAPAAPADKVVDPKVSTVEPTAPAPQKPRVAKPHRPAPAPSHAPSEGAERALSGQIDQKTPAKAPAPPIVEPPRTIPEVASVPVPVAEELPRKKRKPRKTGAEEAQEQKPAAADTETRRRAILAQRRRTRGKGR